MAEPFDLAPDPYAPPLNIVEPPQPSAQPTDKRQLLKLALILGAASRGGPGAIQGVLSGWNQSQQEQRQQLEKQQLLAQQDAVRRQTLAQSAARDAAVNERAKMEAQQKFLTGLPGMTAGIDSPEQLTAMQPVLNAQAQNLGIDPAAVQAMLPPPTVVQKRQAEKYIGKMKATYGDEWMERTGGMTHVVGGEQMPIEEVLRRAELPAAKPQAATAKPETRSLEVQAAEALAKGDTETYKRLIRVKKEMGQADDRPQPQATILIQTIDENGQPVQRLVPRTPGTSFAPAPTAGQQSAMAEQQAGLDLIGDIERIYRPEYVGPLVGRATKAQMAIPGTPDVSEDVAMFYSSVANLRNEIIRLISGAAVSASEETRMRDQLPDVTDKPSVFRAKLAQTKRNREQLLQRMQQRSGQKVTQPTAPQPSGVGTKQRIGRFDVEVEP